MNKYTPVSYRERMLTANTDVNAGTGLEFGALNHPIIPPAYGNIKFVDYAPTEVLKQRHNSHPDRVNNMVAVDYVWSGSGSLRNVIPRDIYFDFAIACHVIEHVPNLLGWFRGVTEALRQEGVLNLAIPDLRFTFDAYCPPSTLGMAVEADLMAYSRPSIRQMFDHCYYAKAIQPGEAWSATTDLKVRGPYSGAKAPQLALTQATNIRDRDIYIDSHCWIFTPLSFLHIIEGAIDLGLFDLLPLHITQTNVGEFEFYASFQRFSNDLGLSERRTQQQLALIRSRQVLEQSIKESHLLASGPQSDLQGKLAI